MLLLLLPQVMYKNGTKHVKYCRDPSFSSFWIQFIVCSLVHDVKSTMSLQKSGKSDQKSLLSMVKPPTYRGKWRDRVLLKKSLTLWRRLLKTSRNRLLLILLKQVLPTASYLWQETEHICQETATGTGPSRLAALIIICCFTIVKVRMLYKSINKQQDFIKKNTDKVYIRDSYHNWKSMCNQKKKGFRNQHQEPVTRYISTQKKLSEM